MVLRTPCVIERHMRAIHSDDFDQINEKIASPNRSFGGCNSCVVLVQNSLLRSLELFS